MYEFVDLIDKYFDPKKKKPISAFFEQVGTDILQEYGIKTVEPIKYGRQNYDIFEVIQKKNRYYVFESRVIGEDINLYSASHDERDISCDFVFAPNRHLIKLIRDFKVLNQNKVLFEYVGDNMKYDPELGFGMFDFERIKNESNDFYSIFNLKKEQLLKAIELGRADITEDDAEEFFRRVKSLYNKYKRYSIGEIDAELYSITSSQ